MISIWKRLAEVIAQSTENAFYALVEGVRVVFSGDVETRRQVAFSVAMIALSAKMAKADGVVSDAEIQAFYEIFAVPDAEMRHVEKVYNLSKQDIAGFDYYARRLFQLCRDSDCDQHILENVLDGLFHIAKADGEIHQDEVNFLKHVADIFTFSSQQFDAIAARHCKRDSVDPWAVLGLERGASFTNAKKRYRELVRKNHPDLVLARGLPVEFLAIAHERLSAINVAWEALKKELVYHDHAI